MRKVYTLLQVTEAVRRAIDDRVRGQWFWVKVEMVKLNHYPHSGHCYPDFVERRDGRVAAQMRGMIWARDYEKIAREFHEVVGEPLRDGMELLVEAGVRFHPVHGLSLQVRRVDPHYSLGGLLRRRRETIQRLKAEGLFDQNRQRPFPLLPKVLAVVSVATSKGYQDFRAVVDASPFPVVHKLFPAFLQGEEAVPSIVRQLRRIARHMDVFDAVLIVRGGGGEVGLSAYDAYPLAHAIAAHPLPVLTGIGHSTNQTVAEQVSWRSFITPTDMARFVVGRFEEAAAYATDAAGRLHHSVARILREESVNLIRRGGRLRVITSHRLGREAQQVADWKRRMRLAAARRMEKARQHLYGMERAIHALSPRNVLKRGYALVELNGKIVTSAAMLREGMVIRTIFSDGRAESIVLQTQKEEDHDGRETDV